MSGIRSPTSRTLCQKNLQKKHRICKTVLPSLASPFPSLTSSGSGGRVERTAVSDLVERRPVEGMQAPHEAANGEVSTHLVLAMLTLPPHSSQNKIKTNNILSLAKPLNTTLPCRSPPVRSFSEAHLDLPQRQRLPHQVGALGLRRKRRPRGIRRCV